MLTRFPKSPTAQTIFRANQDVKERFKFSIIQLFSYSIIQLFRDAPQTMSVGSAQDAAYHHAAAAAAEYQVIRIGTVGGTAPIVADTV